MTIAITTSATAPAPGDTVRVTATASTSDSRALSYMKIAMSGLVQRADSVAFTGTGAQSISIAVVVPPQPAAGTLTITATAVASGGISGTGTTAIAVGDNTPPVLGTFSVSPTTGVQPGDSVTVSLAATDNAGLAATVVRWSGAVSGTDSAAANFARSVSRAVKIRIPSTAPVNGTLVITAEAIDLADAHANGSLPGITLTDHTLPTVAASITGGDSLGFVVGDTLRVRLSGTDNASLAWVGYSLAAPANVTDSVAVSGATATSTLTRVIGSAWLGSSPVTIFARDASGNRVTGSTGSIAVSNFVRHATVSAPLAAPVRDVAFDAKRNVVYLSEPVVSRVDIVSLNDFTAGTPIGMPAAPGGLDLTLGGDSLLVTLRNLRQLAVVDLRQTARTVQTIALPLTGAGVGPDYLRVLSDNKALFTVTFSGSGYGGQVYQYDLTAGTAARRTDAGVAGGLVTEAVPLARSADRGRALILIDDSCCPEDGQAYTASTSTFGTARGVVSSYGPSISSDSTGAHFLVNGNLLASDLSAIRTFSPAEYNSYGASAISPDGSIAYLAASTGYVTVRTSDGSVIERVRLGFTPTRLVPLPGGTMLLAFTSTRMYGVRLP